MSQTVAISDDLFGRLSLSAQRQGVSIEQLLADWQRYHDDLQARREAVDRARKLRERLYVTYGEQSDSAAHVRADRMRE
jgi:peptide methionine sulfoxide reductase MsrA